MKVSIEVELDDADSIAALFTLARLYEFSASRQEISTGYEKFWSVDLPNSLTDLFGVLQSQITAMEWHPHELSMVLGNGAEWKNAVRWGNRELKELGKMLEMLPRVTS